MIFGNASETINNYSNRVDLVDTSTFAIIDWLSRADLTMLFYSCWSKTKRKWKASPIDSLFLFNTKYSLFSRSIYRPIIPAAIALHPHSPWLSSAPKKLNSMFPSAIIPISLSNVSLKFLSMLKSKALTNRPYPAGVESVYRSPTIDETRKNEPTTRIATQNEPSRRYPKCKKP